jgi:uncharacterized protein Yka (UPF0111/DUF47 family)
MNPTTRIASRASVLARTTRRPLPTARFPPHTQTPRFRLRSTEAGSNASSSSSSSSNSPAIIGALTGSLATFTIGYLWYRQSGARELLTATKKTKDYVNTASKKLKESTPEPKEALNWLRDAARSYAVFIPGARGYIDSAFEDLDAIREKHGDEVDSIVREAYQELQDIANNGTISLLSAQKAWQIIVKHLGRIGDLAGDAASQILDNHPQLKEKLGGNVDKLKEYGEKYGSEAKEEVDRTWRQISEVIQTGLSPQNVEKVKSIVQEKVDKVNKLANEAWEKGMQQAKPYLDNNPQLKKIIEQNADALKSGNVQELYDRIKSAVESGNFGDLQQYIDSAVSKANSKGQNMGLDTLLEKVPGGDQIMPKLQRLSEVASKHGDEAQRIFKEAVGEVGDVLKRKGSEAEELAEKAKKESNK